MSVILDVLRSYKSPRTIFRKRLGNGPAESRALVVLMTACALVFVAQTPRLARQAFETGEELNMLLGASLLAWLFIAPLIFYCIAGVSQLILRLFRQHTTPFQSRFALFWGLLCATPLWLLWGLVAGFIGPSRQLDICGLAALLAFLSLWLINTREAISLSSLPSSTSRIFQE